MMLNLEKGIRMTDIVQFKGLNCNLAKVMDFYNFKD